MKKLFKKIRTVCIVSTLSLSLCFGSVTASYYQAAALAPTVWTLIETLFLSLGITLHLSDSVNKEVVNEEIAQEVQEMAEKIESGEQKGPLLELADCLKNIHMYWEPLTGLTIPQTIWEALKYYCGVKVETTGPIYLPIDGDINLYGCTQEQYTEFLASYLNTSLKVGFEKFCGVTYPLFYAADYSFIIQKNKNVFLFYPLDKAESYHFREYSNGESCYLYPVSKSDLSSGFVSDVYFYNSENYSFIETSGFPIELGKSVVFLMVKGRLYDLNEVCSKPANITMERDYGSSFCIDSFLTPTMDICTGVTVESVIDIPLDDYDVKTPGREWDEEKDKLVGDVTINIPDRNILDDYYEGLITWEQLMELLGVEPVDTTKPVDNDIPKEDTSDGIIDVILDIPGAIVDGIKGLFLPREGFIEGRFNLVMKRIEKLGILPYDMSDIFKNNGNPFKDIKIDVYGQEVTIVSFKYLPAFITKFRPAIRGLMALFMIYYSINQFLGLLRISGLVQGDNGGTTKETGGTAK